MITQRMLIKPSDKVFGDFFNYTYDAEGKISYSASLTAGVFIFKKTYTFNGAIKVDPQFLKSKNLIEGMEMILKDLCLKLEKVDNEAQEAMATVSYKAGELKGLVVFDLSKEDVQLKGINLLGQFKDQDLDIQIL